jgi:protein-tyrosine phosphatase
VEPVRFVDVHSHVVPSGDDGVATVEEGLELCREAARRGTGVLYATPHVWPFDGLSPQREEAFRAAHEAMARETAAFGLTLGLGFELTPAEALVDESLERYVLAGIEPATLLVEVPFTGGLRLFDAVCERAERDGFRLVIAHPERAEAVLEDPARAGEIARPGRLLQVNATSLLGRHGPGSERLGWGLLESGVAALVGSDGHRVTRPPYLDDAYELARARLGSAAQPCFDGSALGLSSAARLA